MTIIARLKQLEKHYVTKIPLHDDVYELWEKDGKQYDKLPTTLRSGD